jgi:DNA-binding LacI/PurR family transcriptional regulator
MALERHLPTLLVARPGIAGAPAVTLDHATGMALALTHLGALGHQRIALPVYPEGRAMPTSRLRLETARALAAERGWPAPLELDAAVFDGEGLIQWLQQARAADPPLTAVVASDLVAVRVLKAAQAACIDVPAQLSVVALDGTEVTGYTTPSLTAVVQPLEQLGRTAAELLLRRLGNGDAARNGSSPEPTPPTTLLAPSFTVRASTAPAAEGRRLS